MLTNTQVESKSTNRSYNSSTDFIMTHENFQIRKLNSEAAFEPVARRLATQETAQKSALDQAQTEAVRNQYFATEPSDSSKAIVQSLLNKNENVNTQLSKLLG